MARTVSIGAQDFEYLIQNNYFYVDKTGFIKDWWESGDPVTLITRPRRFGKTLNLNMLERFFSVDYAGQGGIFEGLDIWEEKKYQELQGTYPVIFLSFAGVKADNYEEAKEQIFQIIEDLYVKQVFLKKSGMLEKNETDYFERIGKNMSNSEAVLTLQRLSGYLYRYYGKKTIVLLDEYDTPIQEAYVNGYWRELLSFMRNLFNNTFKTNPYMERAVMTGITRISKESLFSDLNNLNVVTMTSDEYAFSFGFTENEVFAAMDEFGMQNKDDVKRWYDGFSIGSFRDIYNPWSIINFLDKGKLKPYWANTSSNSLVASLIRKGNKDLKMQFEELLKRRSITSRMDEEIVFDRLDGNEKGVWSFLLAAGYLKVVSIQGRAYELALTNHEVELMFDEMVLDWFDSGETYYNDFVRALLRGNLKDMNQYMKQMALAMFGSFDGGNHPSKVAAPERFYHGFVLGLLVDLSGRYEVLSNRESGFGRYDVMLKPLNKADDGIILEFKVRDSAEENDLEETVRAALRQIEEKQYETELLNAGIERGRIRKYGFAFQGKNVLIGNSEVCMMKK